MERVAQPRGQPGRIASEYDCAQDKQCSRRHILAVDSRSVVDDNALSVCIAKGPLQNSFSDYVKNASLTYI